MDPITKSIFKKQKSNFVDCLNIDNRYFKMISIFINHIKNNLEKLNLYLASGIAANMFKPIEVYISCYDYYNYRIRIYIKHYNYNLTNLTWQQQAEMIVIIKEFLKNQFGTIFSEYCNIKILEAFSKIIVLTPDNELNNINFNNRIPLLYIDTWVEFTK